MSLPFRRVTAGLKGGAKRGRRHSGAGGMVAAGERCSWPRPVLSFPQKAVGPHFRIAKTRAASPELCLHLKSPMSTRTLSALEVAHEAFKALATRTQVQCPGAWVVSVMAMALQKANRHQTLRVRSQLCCFAPDGAIFLKKIRHYRPAFFF